MRKRPQLLRLALAMDLLSLRNRLDKLTALLCKQKRIGTAKVPSQQNAAYEKHRQVAPADHAPTSQKLLRAIHSESVGLQHALQQQFGIRPDMRWVQPKDFRNNPDVFRIRRH